MEGIKIEVLRENTWEELQLKSSQRVETNITAGSIKTPSTRKITHSNTLKIPSIETNLSTLGLNPFNVSDLIEKANNKYSCRISAELGIISEGYLIVGNTSPDEISINLFPNELGLLDLWGSNSLVEAFSSTTASEIPTDMKDELDRARSYTIPGELGTFQPQYDLAGGYPILFYPNTMNKIGDEYSILSDGTRAENSMNAHQGRPIFNCRALIELSAYAFGYTLEFSSTIDLDSLQEEFITAPGTAKGVEGSKTYSQRLPAITTLAKDSNVDEDHTLYGEESTGQLFPKNIQADLGLYWNDYSALLGVAGYYWKYPSVFPFKNESKVGLVTVNMSHTDGSYPDSITKVIVGGAWTTNHDTEIKGVVIPTSPVINQEIDGQISFTFDKADFEVPYYGGDFLGFTLHVVVSGGDTSGGTISSDIFTNVTVDEEYTTTEGGFYDKNSQYEEGDINLLKELPDISVKSFISTMLERYGLKMEIQEDSKNILLYTYEDILKEVASKNWEDWSKYKIKTLKKTTYLGDNYASKTTFSLSNPLRGNSYTKQLLNQGVNSRYQSETTKELEGFNDLESIDLVPEWTDPDTEGVTEVTLTGMGMVKVITGDEIPQAKMWWYTVDGVNQSMLPVPHVTNIDYSKLPKGVDLWYDVAATCAAETSSFLLSRSIVDKVDLKKPIYIDGNVYILDEILQYVGSDELCIVELLQISSKTLDLI